VRNYTDADGSINSRPGSESALLRIAVYYWARAPFLRSLYFFLWHRLCLEQAAQEIIEFGLFDFHINASLARYDFGLILDSHHFLTSFWTISHLSIS
jgi:hypothetical protein